MAASDERGPHLYKRVRRFAYGRELAAVVVGDYTEYVEFQGDLPNGYCNRQSYR